MTQTRERPPVTEGPPETSCRQTADARNSSRADRHSVHIARGVGLAPPTAPRLSCRQAAEHREDEDSALDLIIPLDDPETRAEIWRIVAPLLAEARREFGYVAPVESTQWWDGTDATKLGGVLVLALAWATCDPHRRGAAQLKQDAADISRDVDWAAVSGRLTTPDTLRSRRAQLGPMARAVDPVAARRWAATGDSCRDGAG